MPTSCGCAWPRHPHDRLERATLGRAKISCARVKRPEAGVLAKPAMSIASTSGPRAGVRRGETRKEGTVTSAIRAGIQRSTRRDRRGRRGERTRMPRALRMEEGPLAAFLRTLIGASVRPPARRAVFHNSMSTLPPGRPPRFLRSGSEPPTLFIPTPFTPLPPPPAFALIRAPLS